MIFKSDRIEDYLKTGKYIDFHNPEIIKAAERLTENAGDEIEAAAALYHFVRDDIRHSWDAQDPRITVTASQVLREGTGICWAKANLLAALLRARGIPAGICYQRLTLGDTPETGFCIHALNVVYLKTLNKWIRVDARGNKTGVNAEMHTDREQLAFPIRPTLGELDYPEVWFEPAPVTMDALENAPDALELYLNGLPDRL